MSKPRSKTRRLSPSRTRLRESSRWRQTGKYRNTSVRQSWTEWNRSRNLTRPISKCLRSSLQRDLELLLLTAARHLERDLVSPLLPFKHLLKLLDGHTHDQVFG